jgi:hypothetical protein
MEKSTMDNGKAGERMEVACGKELTVNPISANGKTEKLKALVSMS